MHNVFGDHRRSSAFDEPTPLPHRMPIEHAMERRERGWHIRLPVYEERAIIGREVAVAEEVEISLRTVQDYVRAQDEARREVPDVETRGDLEVTRPVDVSDLQRTEVRRARSSRTLRQLRSR